jgi:hypothetical protein
VLGLVRLLGTLNSWVDDIPPAVHSLRYGNPAYRWEHSSGARRRPPPRHAAFCILPATRRPT